MTCIVGLEHAGHVYIGGDSAGVAGYSLTVRADSKVFTRPITNTSKVLVGNIAVGFTTSFRMGQIVRYSFKVPPLPADVAKAPTDENVERYLVAKFVPALRKTFGSEGFEKADNGRASGGCFLLGILGRLYAIERDYQVARNAVPYAAVGCGDELALGAMHMAAAWTRAEGMPELPQGMVTMALEAAAAYSAGVRGPFTVVAT